MPESQSEYSSVTSNLSHVTSSSTSHTYPVKNIQIKTSVVDLDGGENVNSLTSIVPNSTEVNQLPVQVTINCDAADSLQTFDATGVTVTNITVALSDGTAVAGTFAAATQRWTPTTPADTNGESGVVATISGFAPNEAGTLKITGSFS